ncbi:50S ribosomal protein L18 [Halarsenatibacter silvermanii]|uniref:Large ribosomal subunit protein uL18 n=1 Tax=Halarsenatibacter silvermanii TaxID=321763 RepID=A0A1G9NB80_9FIRM|nr:50S ribosomal protein L18 [Halarsenatibacter silvermanii]SDL83722.1 LSU ribosomal protein L18P [Halarsenatibacter silvermanii]
MSQLDKREARERRHKRIRKDIMGTPSRPRMCVNRSLKNIHVQVIDDLRRETLVSASTDEPEIAQKVEYGGNKEAARVVGEFVANRALEEGIEKVVFDRAGYQYHGRVKALAEAAREAGLEF